MIYIFTSLSTLYRSYHDGQFFWQMKPVHTVGVQVLYCNLSLIYLLFYVIFNIVQVISRQPVFFWQRKPVHTVGVQVLYCKLSLTGKQLLTFPHEVQGLNRRLHRCVTTTPPWPLLHKYRTQMGENLTPCRNLDVKR